jgi:hypothetical protein
MGAGRAARLAVTTFEIVGLSLVVISTVNYFVIFFRMEKIGYPVKLFSTVFDLMKLFAKYREVAPVHGWSRAQVYSFWLFGGIGIVLFAWGASHHLR